MFIGIFSYLFKTIINKLKIKKRNKNIDDLIITPRVTTKMFKVLDTCARFRIGEMTDIEAAKQLKLKNNNVKKYCQCFIPQNNKWFTDTDID